MIFFLGGHTAKLWQIILFVNKMKISAVVCLPAPIPLKATIAFETCNSRQKREKFRADCWIFGPPRANINWLRGTLECNEGNNTGKRAKKAETLAPGTWGFASS